jgi:hypothetical protein
MDETDQIFDGALHWQIGCVSRKNNFCRVDKYVLQKTKNRRSRRREIVMRKKKKILYKLKVQAKIRTNLEPAP